MRAFKLLCAAVALLLAGCAGGGGVQPEMVAREFMDAILAGDEETAARHYSPGFGLVQVEGETLVGRWTRTLARGVDGKLARVADPPALFPAAAARRNQMEYDVRYTLDFGEGARRYEVRLLLERIKGGWYVTGIGPWRELS